MLQNAYFLAKIDADTAENEQHFAEICQKLATTLRVRMCDVAAPGALALSSKRLGKAAEDASSASLSPATMGLSSSLSHKTMNWGLFRQVFLKMSAEFCRSSAVAPEISARSDWLQSMEVHGSLCVSNSNEIRKDAVAYSICWLEYMYYFVRCLLWKFHDKHCCSIDLLQKFARIYFSFPMWSFPWAGAPTLVLSWRRPYRFCFSSRFLLFPEFWRYI